MPGLTPSTRRPTLATTTARYCAGMRRCRILLRSPSSSRTSTGLIGAPKVCCAPTSLTAPTSPSSSARSRSRSTSR
ncbi:unnamed protein product [Leptidea sinapis]|uniref:Uncharacterized protein n=1 Tax=Leptidea sinapis TaxID=189913 RepID=A0A5E4PW35_9NEOP|nr:unnamed protein product [Leptidea sinapis]